jgi:hypothetical protein
VFGAAGGLGLANCGGLRATDAGPGDAAVSGDSGEAAASSSGGSGSSSGVEYEPPEYTPPPPCTTNSECAVGSLCRSDTGLCVECLSNTDCHDPDRPVCASNGCACTADTDCTALAHGPHCLLTCECNSAADCTQSPYGLACVSIDEPTVQQGCGCTSDNDCPPRTTCHDSQCVGAGVPDGGTIADAGLDAATGSVRCVFAFADPQGGSGGGGSAPGCNGTYRSDLGAYSVMWTQPDGGTVVCDSSNQDALANCAAGTPCVYTAPMLALEGLPGGAAMGTCR